MTLADDEDETSSGLSDGLKMFLLVDILIAVAIWHQLGAEGLARKTCQVGADRMERFEKTCAKLERD